MRSRLGRWELSALVAVISVLAGWNPCAVISPAHAGGANKPAMNFAVPSTPIVFGSGDLGYLPGSSHVGVDGSYNYTIPIEVPAGQMTPHLALQYSSRAGNGVLGVGWSLSGLSSITRCRQTLSSEGAVNGVHMTDFSTTPEAQRDRFCLDGKKLIAINGSYGADNTEYRTEEDSYQRIISHSTSTASATQGPDSFTVSSANGQVSTYSGQLLQRNAENASQASAAGQVEALWMLRSETDTVGNGVQYIYNIAYSAPDAEGVVGQQVELKEIVYTTHAGSGSGQYGARSVTFGYNEDLLNARRSPIAKRADQEIAWQAGVKTQLVDILTSITMAAPDPGASLPVWQYTIAYQPGGSSFSGRSLLQSVQRCALNGSTSAQGSCTWHQNFSYTTASSTPTFTDTSVASASNIPIAPVPAPQPGTINGTPYFAAPVVNFFGPMPYLKVLDVNGDGLDDVLFQPGQTLAWSAQAAGYAASQDPNAACHSENTCVQAPAAIAPLLLMGTRATTYPYAVSALAQSYDLSNVAGGDLFGYNNATPLPVGYDGSLGYFPWGALENLTAVDIDGSGKSSLFMAAPVGAGGCSYRALDWGTYLNGPGVGFSDRGTAWAMGSSGCINWAAQAQWLAAIRPVRNFLFLDIDGDNRPDVASYVANIPVPAGTNAQNQNVTLSFNSDLQVALNLGANTLTPVSLPSVGGGGVSANCPFYAEDFYGDGRTGLFGQTFSPSAIVQQVEQNLTPSATGCGASEIFFRSAQWSNNAAPWEIAIDGVDTPPTAMPDFSTQDYGTVFGPQYGPQEYYGDFNGDGLQDVITVDNTPGNATWPAVPQVRWNTGNGFGPPHPLTLSAAIQEIGAVNSKVVVADINGDGRDDLVIFHEDCIGVPYTDYSQSSVGNNEPFGCVATDFKRSITLMLSNGDGTFNQVNITPQGSSVAADPGVLTPEGWTTSVVGDFNGDGRLDIARVVGGTPQNTILMDGSPCIGQVDTTEGGPSACSGSVSASYQIVSGTLQILTQQPPAVDAPADLLATITDEGAQTNREAVQYLRQWSDKPIACNGISYPQHCLSKGLAVVRSVFSSDTRADSDSSTLHGVDYSYEEPVMDQRGPGFLGFHEVRVWDPTRLQQTITVYDNFHETGTLLPSPAPPPVTPSYSYTPALFLPGYYPGAERPLSVTTVTALPNANSQKLPGLPSDAPSPPTNARVVQTLYNNQLVTGSTLEANNPLVYALWPVANATTPAQTTWEWEQQVNMAANVNDPGVPYSDYLWGANCLLLADPSATNPAVPRCVPPSTAIVHTLAIPSGGIDSYGNITSQIAQTSTNDGTVLGEEILTSATYNNLTTPSWLIGQLTSQNVVALEADPAVAAVHRRVVYDYDANGLLQDTYTCAQATPSAATPCGNFALLSTQTLTHDSYGNITSIATIAQGSDGTMDTRQVNIEYDPLWPNQPNERIFPSQYWMPVALCSTYSGSTCVASWTPSSGVLIHPAYGVVSVSVDAAGLQSIAQYDDQGRLLNFTPPAGDSTSISYVGRVDRSTLGGINGMVLSRTHAGQTQSVFTDAGGHPIQSTHQGFDGSVITDSYVQYDVLGRAVAAFRPYPGAGVPQPGNPPPAIQYYYASTAYDGLNRVVCRSLPDPVGNTGTACALPAAPAAWSTTTYGYTFNAATDTYPVPASPAFSRPVSSVTSTDANGNQSRSDVDIDGRTVATANYLSTGEGSPGWLSTYFHYAAFGQVDGVITPALPTQTPSMESTRYDTLGRVIAHNSPDMGTTNLGYDGFGELLSSTHAPSGALDAYQYDVLGRQTLWTSTDGPTSATFAYDTQANGLGKLATASSSDNVPSDTVTTVMHYDLYGRAIGTDETVGGQTYTVSKAYNSLGQVAQVNYPRIGTSTTTPWITLRNTYNGAGYLSEVDYSQNGAALPPVGDCNTGQCLWRVKARNVDDALAQATFGDTVSKINVLHGFTTYSQLAVEVQNTYSLVTGRPQQLLATPDSTTTPILNLSYGYYPNGLVQTRTDAVNGRQESFGYDSLNRFTNWNLSASTCTTVPCAPPASAGAWQGYDYDTTGNLTQVSQVKSTLKGLPIWGVVQSNTYGGGGGGPHALSAQTNAGVSASYNYDTHGRQTTGTSQTLTYNAYDLPKTVTYNGATSNLLYDAFGQRVRKSRQDGTSSTVYVGGMYEKRTTGSVIVDVFHVPGGQLEYNESGGNTTEYGEFTDALGSVGTVFNGSTGTVTTGQAFFYEPFGARINLNGTVPYTGNLDDVHDGFTGQEHDDEYGLINFKGRMYNPTLKRFLSPDPHVTAPGFGQSWNPYSYVNNSPLNFVDPTGFDADDPFQGLGMGDSDLTIIKPPEQPPTPQPAPPGTSDNADGTWEGTGGTHVTYATDAQITAAGLWSPSATPAPGATAGADGMAAGLNNAPDNQRQLETLSRDDSNGEKPIRKTMPFSLLAAPGAGGLTFPYTGKKNPNSYDDKVIETVRRFRSNTREWIDNATKEIAVIVRSYNRDSAYLEITKKTANNTYQYENINREQQEKLKLIVAMTDRMYKYLHNMSVMNLLEIEAVSRTQLWSDGKSKDQIIQMTEDIMKDDSEYDANYWNECYEGIGCFQRIP